MQQKPGQSFGALIFGNLRVLWVFAVGGFSLFVFAYVYGSITGAVPDELRRAIVSVGSIDTIRAIGSIWIAAIAVSVLFPITSGIVGHVTAVTVDLFFGLLGAVIGVSPALAMLVGDWRIAGYAIAAVIAAVIFMGVLFSLRGWIARAQRHLATRLVTAVALLALAFWLLVVAF